MMYRSIAWVCGMVLFIGCAKDSSQPTATAASPQTATKTAIKKPAASRTPPKQTPTRALPASTPWFWRYQSSHQAAQRAGSQLAISSKHTVFHVVDKATQKASVVLKDDKGRALATYSVPTSCPRGSASFAAHKGLVYVVTFDMTLAGACVHALSKDDLEPMWTHRAKALSALGGKVIREKFVNRVQLTVYDNRLWISGREGGDAYSESLDLVRGTLMSTAHVRPFAKYALWPAKIAFPAWQGKYTTPAKSQGEDATFELLLSQKDANHSDMVTTLKRINATSGVQWQKRYPARFMGRAKMIECGDVVVVGRHSRIASGLVLDAVDAKTGKSRWHKQAFGAGLVEHSKYSNQVELACDAKNAHVIVYGHESAAKYIERRDLKTGRLLANTRFYP